MLKSLIDLRNVLVHEEGNAIYAIPSDEALTALKEIQEEYHKPRKVYDLLKKPVERVEANQRLSYVLGLMKETNFSQLPAYDGDRFIGLVNGNVISRWLASNLDMGGNLIKNLGSVDIRHVLDFQEKCDKAGFIPRDMDIYEFLDYVESTPAPSGIYIMTEHGRIDEFPVCIITAEDYDEVLRAADI